MTTLPASLHSHQAGFRYCYRTECYSSALQPLDPCSDAQLVQGHPILQHEYARVKAGKPLESLDTTRFHLEPPPANQHSDFNAWRKATDNAHSQLEHQYNRLALCILWQMLCM